ncbi:hypothetical protein [Vibrio rhizosphaerae]|nr:hypothetical protein [Vibrio rhizosphaerae]
MPVSITDWHFFMVVSVHRDEGPLFFGAVAAQHQTRPGDGALGGISYVSC